MPKSRFFSLTPIVSFAYFVLFGAAMAFFTHPAAVAVHVLCAGVLCRYIIGRKAFFKTAVFALSFSLLMALLNPVFSHKGVTIITYLPDGNPLTLESVIYGAVSGARLLASLLLFASLCRVMTSERITYLLGRVLPSAAVLFSAALSLVPQMIKTAAEIHGAVTLSGDNGGARRTIREFSMLATAMLERGADSAQSMRARGWGVGARSSYSAYSLKRRDCMPLSAMAIAAIGLLLVRNRLHAVYYPAMVVADFSGLSLVILLFLGLLPIFYDAARSLVWKLSK